MMTGEISSKLMLGKIPPWVKSDAPPQEAACQEAAPQVAAPQQAAQTKIKNKMKKKKVGKLSSVVHKHTTTVSINGPQNKVQRQS